MFSFFLSFLISVSVVIIFRHINTKHKSPRFGIYQLRNKNYWFKFIFMYAILRSKQLMVYLSRLYVEFRSKTDAAIHVQDHDLKLEQLYNLGDYPKAVDGVYFNGMSRKGDIIICGLARRPNQICDAFFYLKVQDGELLLSPKLPDTYLKQSPEDGAAHKVQGLSIYNFVPMRTWKFAYDGEMKTRSNPDKVVKVKTDLIWGAFWTPFEYDTHMSARGMASCMAREPWSRDYFQLLKKMHQSHYEQMGFMSGTVTIDGQTHNVHMPCVRDRTCARMRDWRNFHRYVLHFIFLDNGDCMEVGTVSMPSILSHVTIGYLCLKADQSVIPVNSCDFKLYQHAENQSLPTDYGFIFKAGGYTYEVQLRVYDEVSFYIGKDREAKLYERWCDVTVNGVKGIACTEWHYNNTKL